MEHLLVALLRTVHISRATLSIRNTRMSVLLLCGSWQVTLHLACDFRDAGISGKKLTRRQFMIKIAEVLLGHMQSKPSKKRRKSDENGRGKPVIFGGVMPISDNKRNCIHCYHTLKKQMKTRARDMISPCTSTASKSGIRINVL